jgi:hypothetical protein
MQEHTTYLKEKMVEHDKDLKSQGMASAEMWNWAAGSQSHLVGLENLALEMHF